MMVCLESVGVGVGRDVGYFTRKSLTRWFRPSSRVGDKSALQELNAPNVRCMFPARLAVSRDGVTFSKVPCIVRVDWPSVGA
jgi:hypothetical protein